MELVEREAHLAGLARDLEETAASHGRVVLVGGEAGAGKSALVDAFARQRGRGVDVLWGACDGLSTPRPLGALLDIARAAGGGVLEAIRSDDRAELFYAVLTELQLRAKPVLLVVEDAHWADEATLDFLRFLARRLRSTRTLLVVTYRNDEVVPPHPMHAVIGELGTLAAVKRLALPPLTIEGVRVLAVGTDVDVEALFRQTGGNPFFVTEALASPDDHVPPTVRDAVLARASRLDADARAVLESASVIGRRAELEVISAVEEAPIDSVERCVASGMLTFDGDAVTFRHELARVAVEAAVPPHRRRVLHARVLGELRKQPSDDDLARLAYHAEQAGDVDAVLRFAVAAGERAAVLRAHREAAAQYARALRFSGGLPDDRLATLHERRSYQCYLTNQIEDAIEERAQALECHRRLGDPLLEGDDLRWLSRLNWFLGRNDEAETAAAEAIALLERFPPGPELAMAYSNEAHLRMLASDADGAAKWGTRAIRLAEKLGETEVLAHALNNVGSAEALAGNEDGWAKLERSLSISHEHDLEEHVARAYTNLATIPVRLRRYPLAERYLDEGIAYSSERDLDAWRLYMLGWRARRGLDIGRWTDAAADATHVIRHPRTALVSRITALVVLGLVRLRRGDPDAGTPLEEALDAARQTGELQRIAPAAAAMAELRLSDGHAAEALELTSEPLARAIAAADRYAIGELAQLRRRAGDASGPPHDLPEPEALEFAGDFIAAARAWDELGCPFHAASALAEADDADALRAALDRFESLGARPAAKRVAHSLRSRGVRGLPRGPYAAARAHPAGLTRRETEVLVLLCEGLRNAQIAARLVISERTVDHHVSSILAKLGVRTRAEAVSAAVAFDGDAAV